MVGWVRSKSEKIVADWLYDHNIRYEYERKVADGVTCDFYLPDANVYIEYWGLDDPAYRRYRSEKEKFYSKQGLELVSLVEEDVKHIDEILPSRLRKTGFLLQPKATIARGRGRRSLRVVGVITIAVVLLIAGFYSGMFRHLPFSTSPP